MMVIYSPKKAFFFLMLILPIGLWCAIINWSYDNKYFQTSGSNKKLDLQNFRVQITSSLQASADRGLFFVLEQNCDGSSKIKALWRRVIWATLTLHAAPLQPSLLNCADTDLSLLKSVAPKLLHCRGCRSDLVRAWWLSASETNWTDYFVLVGK